MATKTDRETVMACSGFHDKLKKIQELVINHGITVTGYVEPIPKKADRVKLVRVCPVHGRSEVAMRQFTEHGVFWCPACSTEKGINKQTDAEVKARRRRAYLKKVSVGGKAKLGKAIAYAPRKLYVGVSSCSRYLKIGVTTRNPTRRLHEVSNSAKFAGNHLVFSHYTYFETTGVKASILEGYLKRELSHLLQTDLVPFAGSGEILKRTDDPKFMSNLLLLSSSVEGKTWKPEVDGIVTQVEFLKGEVKFVKMITC